MCESEQHDRRSALAQAPAVWAMSLSSPTTARVFFALEQQAQSLADDRMVVTVAVVVGVRDIRSSAVRVGLANNV